ncbi:unnamed protein product [Durusdinium trenchii]|uniref:Kinesin motor domain-containing protein n=1 Tax=Durusdinium trenchii TaxID=1381693 RepID=A0ABP0NCM1_9DINO
MPRSATPRSSANAGASREVTPRSAKSGATQSVASQSKAAERSSPSSRHVTPCASPAGGSTPRRRPAAPSFGGATPRPESKVELLWGSGSAREGSRTPARTRRTASSASLSSSTPSTKSKDATRSSTNSRANSASYKRPRSIPESLVCLRDVCGGEARRLATEFPDWEGFFNGLAGLMRDEVTTHLKSCGKCRAVSSFSRSNSRFQIQPFSEASLATVCQSCLQSLNASLLADLQKQKDTLLTDIADALGMSLRDLLCFEGVALQRQDERLSSLPIVASERTRILSQGHLREETQHMWIELQSVRQALKEWNSLAWPFEGRYIPHKYGSVVSSSDVQNQANRKCKLFAQEALLVLSDWEAKWPQFKFHEVFSLFGVPMLQLDPKTGIVDSLDLDDNYDDPVLDEVELSALQPMRVVTRVRPMLSHEEGDDVSAEILDEHTVSFETLHHGYVPARHTLQFDAALRCSQTELFRRSGVRALVHRACEGFTCSIFAYGQTGAGKTYSLFGPPESLSHLVDDELAEEAKQQLPIACHRLIDEARRAKSGKQGLLPRALQFLFRVLKDLDLESCEIHATFMEIYNETIFDLFEPSAARLDVYQRPGSEVGFHVPGLTQVQCSSAIELMQALQRGLSSRHSHGHSASRESSRAHAIFTVEIRLPGNTAGKLIFADLAGSERLKRISGADQKETGYINKSLLMLSNCVSALSANPPTSPPGAFRNSKLTKVLMEALCGTGFTILLAAISPAKRHFDETANTLNFAAKCGSIPRQVVNNEPEHQRELRQLQEMVKQLRSEISLLKEGKDGERAAEAEDFTCPGSVEICETVRRDEFQALQAELQREKIRNEEVNTLREALQDSIAASERGSSKDDKESRSSLLLSTSTLTYFGTKAKSEGVLGTDVLQRAEKQDQSFGSELFQASTYLRICQTQTSFEPKAFYLEQKICKQEL